MKNDNKIIITKERREDMVAAIKIRFSKEQGEEIGDLRAKLFLTLLMKNWHQSFIIRGRVIPVNI